MLTVRTVRIRSETVCEFSPYPFEWPDAEFFEVKYTPNDFDYVNDDG